MSKAQFKSLSFKVSRCMEFAKSEKGVAMGGLYDSDNPTFYIKSLYGLLDTDDPKDAFVDKSILTAYGYVLPQKDFFYHADPISQELGDIAEEICDTYGNIKKRLRTDYCLGDAIVISRISVNKKFRNMGAADILMRSLRELASYIEPAACGFYLMASPYELFDSPEYESMQKRLIKFYERYGFKPVKRGSDVLWMPCE